MITCGKRGCLGKRGWTSFVLDYEEAPTVDEWGRQVALATCFGGFSIDLKPSRLPHEKLVVPWNQKVPDDVWVPLAYSHRGECHGWEAHPLASTTPLSILETYNHNVKGWALWWSRSQWSMRHIHLQNSHHFFARYTWLAKGNKMF